MKNKLFNRSYLLLGLILLAFFATVQVFSNPVKFNKFSGNVKQENGKPFPVVYVYLKDFPQFKTTTELNGNFTLILPDSIKIPFTVEFYTVDFLAKTFTVTAKNKAKKINITLINEKKVTVTETKKNNDKKHKKGDDFATVVVTDRASRAGKGKDYSSSDTRRMAADISDAKVATTVTPKMAELAPAESPEVEFSAESIVFDKTEVIDKDYITTNPAQPNVSAGLLTAGELNDFTKWTLWSDIAKNQLETHQALWKILPDERYVAQLTNPDGMPIVDATVSLKDRQGNTIWQARTDNTGKAELWAKMLADGVLNMGEPYSILFDYKGKTAEIEAFPFTVKINSAILKVECSEEKVVDISFIVDATGSMGDEIKYLQAELYDVIAKVTANNPNIELRTGSVFYRDSGDDYLTRTISLDKNIDSTIEFIKKQEAQGGGDFPEAVDIALFEAIENADWRENSLARIAFLILDAPPHENSKSIEKIHRQIRLAAMKGVRIVPLVCSGIDKSTEYLMRSIALATNGTYVFLTDESGIGGSHIKPTTDKYEVEKLNHILLRIITEFSTIPYCNNNWADFTTEINSQEKFLPKPYKEEPAGETERLDLSAVFNIYPNPCAGRLTVNLLRAISDLYIVDATGKALQNFSISSPQSLTVDLSGYSNGIYFINAYCEGRWYSAKFLLNK